MTSGLNLGRRALRTVLLLACVVSVALAGCAAADRELRDAPRLLVKPRAGVTLDALDQILERYGARRIGVIAQINVHIVELPPQANARAVAAMLEDRPEIESAEVDERVTPAR